MSLLLAEPVGEDEATAGLQFLQECEGENSGGGNLYSCSDDYFDQYLLAPELSFLEDSSSSSPSPFVADDFFNFTACCSSPQTNEIVASGTALLKQSFSDGGFCDGDIFLPDITQDMIVGSAAAAASSAFQENNDDDYFQDIGDLFFSEPLVSL